MDEGILDYLNIKRRPVQEIWASILEEGKLDKKIFQVVREKYGEGVFNDFRISARRIATCPYYDLLYSEEYGSHYYLRGKLFEEALIDILSRSRGLEISERNPYLFTRIELEEKIKGYRYAIVHGFPDAIMKRRDKIYVVEAKSSFSSPMIISRLSQAAVYLWLYERMYSTKPKGILIAYLEERDPPIALREIENTRDLEDRIKRRIKEYLLVSKSPVDKRLCDVCPLRDRCEFRTGSPYQGKKRS